MSTVTVLDADRLRADFPILSRPLVYLDSAATSQRPRQVLDAERTFAETSNAAVHRGAHRLAVEASTAYENARATVAAFLAVGRSEIVFTKNATEAINLVAYAMSNADAACTSQAGLCLRPTDDIVVTEQEHHANLVPWQELCRRTGATLRWLRCRPDGTLDLDSLRQTVTTRTRLVAFTHQSNVTGVINPVEAIVERARQVGALTLLDACQSASRMVLRPRDLGVDFVALSGYKMLGPTGIGVLYGRSELLNAMPPFLAGGSMAEIVSMEGATYAEPPRRFEPGVPPVAQAIGLAAAIDYLTNIGMDAIQAHEVRLTGLTVAALSDLPWIRIVGPDNGRSRPGIVSFVADGIHAHDLAQALDSADIAVRAGQHCAGPLHRALGLQASVRASLHVYNTIDDISRLIDAVTDTRRHFAAHRMVC
ncbi:cysteine desulfurase/selenocysteine lyase [Herbihabitans rhizosphaerae]|uniref:cysteine desulfurase n=1 Tax=Herbihabitans rhizosphaerae TaxID=1872711 RepID=A0A4V2EU94_9PSEU|nr:SufS family cysteine desulfurase [Herbihabitans rhizosphaerae]RZS43783.1 cysteine desulfurase/selenocysteine lyase [Herbihabitans rhizosphaerae]